MVHRVVGGLLVRGGQVLLCHRRADRAWYPDCWDVPGGHLEAGESARDALARECREELGIVVRDAEPLAVTSGDPDVDFAVFVVRAWEGEPENLAPAEHDRLAWFDADGCRALRLADPGMLAVLLRALDA